MHVRKKCRPALSALLNRTATLLGLGIATLVSSCYVPNPNVTIGKTWWLTRGGNVQLDGGLSIPLGGPGNVTLIAAKRCLCGTDHEAMLAGEAGGPISPEQAERFAEITAAMRSEATARCELRAHSIAGLDYESDTCAEENADAEAWPLPWADCIIPEPSCPTPLPPGGDSATDGSPSDPETDGLSSSGYGGAEHGASGYDESGADETAGVTPPKGPEVYGLVAWDDVIKCDPNGLSCKISDAFVEALLFNPLLVTNDDVVITPVGKRGGKGGYRLTEFSPDSLPAALSFGEGDVVVRVLGASVMENPLKLLELAESASDIDVEVVDRRGTVKTRTFHKVDF